jgi:hypothetical protein
LSAVGVDELNFSEAWLGSFGEPETKLLRSFVEDSVGSGFGSFEAGVSLGHQCAQDKKPKDEENGNKKLPTETWRRLPVLKPPHPNPLPKGEGIHSLI